MERRDTHEALESQTATVIIQHEPHPLSLTVQFHLLVCFVGEANEFGVTTKGDNLITNGDFNGGVRERSSDPVAARDLFIWDISGGRQIILILRSGL